MLNSSLVLKPPTSAVPVPIGQLASEHYVSATAGCKQASKIKSSLGCTPLIPPYILTRWRHPVRDALIAGKKPCLDCRVSYLRRRKSTLHREYDHLNGVCKKANGFTWSKSRVKHIDIHRNLRIINLGWYRSRIKKFYIRRLPNSSLKSLDDAINSNSINVPCLDDLKSASSIIENVAPRPEYRRSYTAVQSVSPKEEAVTSNLPCMNRLIGDQSFLVSDMEEGPCVCRWAEESAERGYLSIIPWFTPLRKGVDQLVGRFRA